MTLQIASLIALGVVILGAVAQPVQSRPTTELLTSTPCNELHEDVLYNARQGDAAAQFIVGHTYLAGLCGEARQTKLLGLDWLVKAAKNGEANAAFQLARIYEDGTLVAPVFETSFGYYRDAAHAGHVISGRYYGMHLLARGHTVDDVETALFWLGTAASRGDATAATVVGFLHANGLHGVRKDPCQALDWYEASDLIGAPFPLTNLRAEAQAAATGVC